MKFTHWYTGSAWNSLTTQILGAVGVVLIATAMLGCATVNNISSALTPGANAVKMQIFLDSQNFGPGVVDGNAGEFTDKAMALFRQSRGLGPGASIDLSAIVPFTTYTITERDLGQVGPMGGGPEELAKLKRLPYTSLKELLAERFHTTQKFIVDLNGGRDVSGLSAGATVRVPNVSRPFDGANFTAGYAKGSTGGRRVSVDTKIRMLEIREANGSLVAAFPITPGSAEHPAPIGDWRIVGIEPWPWYRYDEGVLKRGERTGTFFNLPPGPNSPVGIMWAGLSHPGVGIHGTGSPETIGRSGSHGCIRLSNWDAATFYTLVGAGTPVSIR
ncbi:MAG: L,D-transpeptidase [Candidatus Methylacidiphilales bacterium]|nr:L,D-transpeptidase [Candidatus Methylacidiphilales bacterium]